MPRVRADRPGSARSILKLPEGQKRAKTDYERWHGRLVSTVSGITSRIKHFLNYGPSDDKALSVFDTFSHSGANQYLDTYHRTLHDYHIACAMELHDIGEVDERLIQGQRRLVVAGGRRKVDDKALDSVQATIGNTSTELAYQFLAENRSVPVGFLRRSLLPHFTEVLVNDYGLEYQAAARAVRAIAAEHGLTGDSKIDFERILQVKNELRWHFDPDCEQAAPGHAPGKADRVPPGIPNDPSRPALTPPALEPPVHSPCQLDDEDRAHIKNVVEKGSWIKVERHDLRNRLKRYLLRNKRALAINGLGVVVSTVLSALTSGGIGAAVTMLTYVGWCVAWSGGTEAIRMVKAIRALQRMEASADFKLEGNEFGVLSELDEKKFRTFMHSLRYVCSHETLARLFNAYSELEKDAELRLAMKPETGSLDELIRLEEGKARYFYRRENLAQAFHLFDQLYSTANADLNRMKSEWAVHVDDLWEHKFKSMPANKRLLLFNRAANDRRIANSFYHYPTNKTDWLKHIFPRMTEKADLSAAELEQASSEVDRIFEEELPDPYGANEEHNAIADRVADAFYLVKDSAKAYVISWLKGGFKSTLTHGFKVSWHGVKGMPTLELAPQLPRPSLDGLAIFAFFFITDILLERFNDAINKHRFRDIQQDKAGATFEFGGITRPLKKRRRTGREEISTLRKLSKDSLPELVDRLLELHDAHKKMMEEIRHHKRLSEIDPAAKPFQHMDDYEAAVLLLKWQYLEQMVQGMMAGAIGQLHESIQDKAEALDGRIYDKLVAEDQQHSQAPQMTHG
ncbi:MAG: hypothetical protein ACR2PT_00810 [Endozoicomonas sp.]